MARRGLGHASLTLWLTFAAAAELPATGTYRDVISDLAQCRRDNQLKYECHEPSFRLDVRIRRGESGGAPSGVLLLETHAGYHATFQPLSCGHCYTIVRITCSCGHFGQNCTIAEHIPRFEHCEEQVVTEHVCLAKSVNNTATQNVAWKHFSKSPHCRCRRGTGWRCNRLWSHPSVPGQRAPSRGRRYREEGWPSPRPLRRVVRPWQPNKGAIGDTPRSWTMRHRNHYRRVQVYARYGNHEENARA